MKKLLLLSPFIILSFISCTVSKRQHQPGYYLKWNKVASTIKKSYTLPISNSIPTQIDSSSDQVLPEKQDLKIEILKIDTQMSDSLSTRWEFMVNKDSLPETDSEISDEVSDLIEENDHNRRVVLPLSFLASTFSVITFALAAGSLWVGGVSTISAIIMSPICLAGFIYSLHNIIRILKFRHRRRQYLRKHKKQKLERKQIKKIGFNSLLILLFSMISLFFFFVLTLAYTACAVAY